MEGANIVPVMDMNRNNGYGDCWGGGMWFMWIIVLFALMGGWGGNWNNRGNMGAEIFANGSMTRDQIVVLIFYAGYKRRYPWRSEWLV